MLTVDLGNSEHHPEVVHTRRGEAVTLRFATPADADELQAYVRSLSTGSRYKRFFGAISELPQALLEDFTQTGRGGGFTVIATMAADGFAQIVGEARYAFHPENGGVEFGLSVRDRWQGHGIGPALLESVRRRAAALGAHSIFGDTLRSNDVMITLARKSGCVLRQHPDDWRLVRFEQELVRNHTDTPSASLRLVSTQ